MSLLLDALKRAEQEKSAKGQGSEAPAQRPAAPALELHPIAPPANARAANDKPSAAATAALAPAPAPKSKRTLWIAAGIVATLAALGAGYVAYSISSLAPRASATIARPAPAPLPTPVAAAASAEPKREAQPERSASLQPLPPAALVAKELPASVAPRKPVRAQAEAVTPAGDSTVQLQRTRAATRVDPDIASGYAALRRGDFDAARERYAAALARDAASVDALLGLATIDARAANRAQAAERYRRILELDPRNATALAGLAALADLSRPDALEAELVADLARHPENASLHFTLGSLHASQGRWSQAQAAFFEAHRLDPANGDIDYNLAVSLDHLGQPRLAASFYRRALDEAKTQSTQFDQAPAARRLAELEGAR